VTSKTPATQTTVTSPKISSWQIGVVVPLVRLVEAVVLVLVLPLVVLEVDGVLWVTLLVVTGVVVEDGEVPLVLLLVVLEVDGVL
jgi:hypothetical protein